MESRDIIKVTNNKSMGRIASLDIAKGILITMLVVSHIGFVGVANVGIENEVLNLIGYMQRPLIVCYFMPAFLFNLYPINPKGVMYSISDFFLTGGLYWFMLSLFIAKMLYYISNRYMSPL